MGSGLMYQAFARTESVCPECLRTIAADKAVGDDGYIYMIKTCPEHGSFETLIWEDGIVDYLKWNTAPGGGNAPGRTVPVKNGCPRDCGLCEEHESAGCCVLLELTRRCSLRCPVCFASAGEVSGEPTLGEISALYDMLMERGGPFNIQLSGGEPTIRDALPDILRLCDSTYETLRGRALLDAKLRAIDNCAAAGLPVVLVPTLVPGVNVSETGGILRFALSRAPHVRGVHFQPVSYFGRCELPEPETRLTIPRVLREIERQTGGLMSIADFGGGGAESPWCSFHASYQKLPGGGLKALPRRESACCCKKSSEARDFVADRWSLSAQPSENEDGFDRFLREAAENSFTVSGMAFMDAYSLDLDRLRRCYICEADSERGMVPFCAYNLTASDGRSLYRK